MFKILRILIFTNISTESDGGTDRLEGLHEKVIQTSRKNN